MTPCKAILFCVLLAALLVVIMAAQAPAETLRPKVDSFILFFGRSGSMVMTSEVSTGITLGRPSPAARSNAEGRPLTCLPLFGPVRLEEWPPSEEGKP